MILRPPPSAAGQVTSTVPSGFAVASTDVGANGTSAVGMTGGDCALGPLPSALTAYTWNTYVLPLVRPPTAAVRWFAPTDTSVGPPVTTYLMIGEPLLGAARHDRRTVASLAKAVTFCGLPGLPFGGGVLAGGT